MKARESGMSEEELWATFFDAPSILRTLQLGPACSDVVEFGCGYGTFTIPAAHIVSGVVYALDIEPEMVELTRRKATAACLKNVETRRWDFVARGRGCRMPPSITSCSSTSCTPRSGWHSSRRHGESSKRVGSWRSSTGTTIPARHEGRAWTSPQAGRLSVMGGTDRIRASAARSDRLAAIPLWLRVPATTR